MENLEEYADPSHYDCEYGEPEPELSFYAYLAGITGGPILDVACGTGRIAIPLSLKGFDVTGIDISQDMIIRGKQKSNETTLNLQVADCRHFDLDQKFKLIYMTGNAFQALLSCADQEMFLKKIRKHLFPDGVFAFDTRFPLLAELSEIVTEEEFWHTYVNPEGLSIRVSGYHIYDPLHQIVEYTTFRRWTEEGQDQVRKTKILLRYTFPLEMKALLHYNGFQIEKNFGDWDRSTLSAGSKKMIYICKLK